MPSKLNDTAPSRLSTISLKDSFTSTLTPLTIKWPSMEAAHRYIGAREKSQFLAVEESELASGFALEVSSASATGHRSAKSINRIIIVALNLSFRIPPYLNTIVTFGLGSNIGLGKILFSESRNS